LSRNSTSFRAVPLPIIRSFLLYIRHWCMSCRFNDSFQARPGWSCCWFYYKEEFLWFFEIWLWNLNNRSLRKVSSQCIQQDLSYVITNTLLLRY
jgi:hypothetical protein